MERLIITPLLVSLSLLFYYFPLTIDRVLAETTEPNEIIDLSQPLKTESKFNSEFVTKVIKLERKITNKDDAEMELGEEKVLDEGLDGKKTQVVETSFYDGKFYETKILSTKIEAAKDKVIAKGTKIVWRTLDTPDGQISYWKKLRVYATHYDQHCPGCNEWTAIGMRAGKGVIAVDPKVIKMRSKVYVPGYGTAVAGDTGGAIKGNIIDLGFDDARTSGWNAKYVDIYLL